MFAGTRIEALGWIDRTSSTSGFFGDGVKVSKERGTISRVHAKQIKGTNVSCNVTELGGCQNGTGCKEGD